MGKLILMGGGFVIVFAGALAGVLAMNGKLNAETLQRFTDPESYAETQKTRMEEAKANEPALGTLANQLNERAKALEERKIALDEREKQLQQREDDLVKAREDLEMLQKSINESFDVAAESRKTQLKTITITLESMEAQSAAQRLEAMPTDEVAEILLSVKDKKRGEILEAMDTETARRVIKEILETGT